ncbi:hypothetical protein [Ensifer sp. Root31]|uniref:hypothetical protein n=1 Tax=Ensifer sp. Root31 TaxID=1736512 RepID=UPI000AF6B3D9|nr:hypothetical protein [Ensifer sp. Root31]
MDKKTIRMPVMMGPHLVERIDEWGFSKKIRTRSSAVRLLIERALAAELAENEKGEATA